MSHCGKNSLSNVSLDNALIAATRRFITGANVHRVAQMIFVYEQAVSLHNVAWPSHRVYQPEHEQALRNFIVQERILRSNYSH